MKLILKLLLVCIIINASARAAMAAMSYYEFKDEAQQAVLFGATLSTDDLRARVLKKAQALQLPLGPDDVLVRREGGRTSIDASYKQGIEYFPNQSWPVDFSFSVEGYSMVLGR